MIPEAEICEHCGSHIKPHKQRLTPGMVHALVKARKAVYLLNRNSFHLYDDLVGENQLTTTEQMNWTKLRFHGLVAKVKNEDGSPKRGYWLITSRGFAFLRGEISIPNFVVTKQNKVIERSTTKVNLASVIGSMPYWDSYSDFEYSTTHDNDEELEPENSPTPQASGKYIYVNGVPYRNPAYKN